MKNARGYTLVEVAIVVGVIGVMAAMMGPLFGTFLTAKRQAFIDKQALVNQAIGQALLEWAAQDSTGSLPAPYTGNGFYSTVLNTLSTEQFAFMQAQLAKVGVSQYEINTDASGGENVRVYQRVGDLSMTLPVYYRSGPQAVLTYEIGVVYATACRKRDTTCNRSPVPGDSPPMTQDNYSTWASSGKDKAAYAISTLPLQKAMLEATVKRIDRMRDAFSDYASARELKAEPNDNSNHLPPSPYALNSENDKTVVDNQFCRDGWYNLNGTHKEFVKYVGLGSEEYGATAWGGDIHYCREYRPLVVGDKPVGVDQKPYYGAFRINKNVSLGREPATGANEADENIFFSF